MRNRHLKFDDQCEIYRLVKSNVPGNAPTTGVEKVPSQTNVPCRKEKDKSVISPTMVGNVPVITEIIMLPPDVDVKENYRIKLNGTMYTVVDPKLYRRFRRRPHHIEATVRALS